MTEDTTDYADDRRLVAGWQGRYYEDFAVGDVYKHPYGRTVTETDNVWLTNLTMNLKREHARPSAARPTGWPEGVGTQPDDLADGEDGE